MFFVCLLRSIFKVIKNNSSASGLNSYNFTMLRYILFEKLLSFKPKHIHIVRIFKRSFVAFSSCLCREDQLVFAFSPIFLITLSW